SAELLRNYFDSWENVVPGELVGGLLSLLGDDKDVRRLAQHYLGQRSVENVRQLLDWRPLDDTVLGARVGGYGEDIHDAMRKQRFVTEIVDSENVTVLNLMGRPFQAPTKKQFDNLLVGSSTLPGVDMQNGYRLKALRFRRVDPSSASVIQPSELL